MSNPLGTDDLWDLRYVSDVRLSPDGQLVAFVAWSYDRSTDSARGVLQIVGESGGDRRTLTPEGTSDASPQWAPDGQFLTVLSGGQVVRVNLSDGERVTLTALDQPVEEYCWSPDGRYICCVSKGASRFPDYPANVIVYDGFRRKDVKSDDWFDGRFRHLWLVDTVEGNTEQLTDEETDDMNPTFSPQGDKLAFVSDRTPNRELGLTSDVWLLDLDSRDLVLLTDSSGPTAFPRFDPGGHRVAFLGHTGDPARFNNSLQIMVRDVRRGGARDALVATSAFDRPAHNVLLTETRRHAPLQGPSWSADGSEILFIGTDRGASNLYRVPADGGEPASVTSGDHEVAEVSFDKFCTSYAALITSTDQPGDVWLGRVDVPELTRVTSINEKVIGDKYLATHERVSFNSFDGLSIEGFLVKPPDFDPDTKYPMIVRIAGGPRLAYGSSFVDEVQIMAGNGYVVFYCNPRGSQSYGESFAEAVRNDWCGRDAQDILAGVDFMIDKGYVDETHIGLTGASYGGALVNWIVTQSDQFAAAVSQRTISNYMSFFGITDFGGLRNEFGGVTPYEDPHRYLARSPVVYARNVTTPVLLMQAGSDHHTPLSQAEEFYGALISLGKRARLVVYPEEKHYFRRYGQPSSRIHYTSTILEWMDHFLKAPSGDARDSPDV